ncbi:low molecular weight protein-tyrosine-phosphatase [Pseudarthrobacter sp. NamE5]|uniref:low molecular weight protein-tyrosine-phosphatase n=1 Tax=Pseudarthrobacter sp. NamE5 TaxID=2576839 RepID=UPI00110B7162|nr:low molecular weight protein-tyrosine-phosphatase [Pseudarthrobacter sp. NamE5]TLM83207.1 low molecular weight phosphotyrosine protein phosphatase [Pseudarthrobacter sp. NamE5]
MNSTTSPYRVIAVCTGNICRSPMAELMLTAALEREGLDGLVTVDSAGTTGYEAGRPIDPRAARRLALTQLVSDRHVAREWVREWFQERDLILALDIDHYAWLSEAAPDQESLEKIRMLRSFDPAMAGRDPLDQGIEDPWYGGHADFDAVWHQIHAALPGIVDHIKAALLGSPATSAAGLLKTVRSTA